MTAPIAEREAVIAAADKWAAEMDRAASDVEVESDGSVAMFQVIDGNRAIAQTLRDCARLMRGAPAAGEDGRLAELRAKVVGRIQSFPPSTIFPTTLRFLTEVVGWIDAMLATPPTGAGTERVVALRPLSEWHEDDGPVLWFRVPVKESPFFAGTPLDSDWPYDADPDGPDPQESIGWCPMPKLATNGAELLTSRTEGAGNG